MKSIRLDFFRDEKKYRFQIFVCGKSLWGITNKRSEIHSSWFFHTKTCILLWNTATEMRKAFEELEPARGAGFHLIHCAKQLWFSLLNRRETGNTASHRDFPYHIRRVFEHSRKRYKVAPSTSPLITPGIYNIFIKTQKATKKKIYL